MKFIEQTFTDNNQEIRLVKSAWNTYMITLWSIEPGKGKTLTGKLEEETSLQRVDTIYTFLKRHPDTWQAIASK